jgi:DNA-binding MarR family transcriptional regulator
MPAKDDPLTCATAILETTPAAMRWIRSEMRANRGARLTVPQLRALIFIRRAEETPLLDLANHLGIAPPSASKLVDGLVNRGLVLRRRSVGDRRRVRLAVSGRGAQRLAEARQATLAAVAACVRGLTSDERRELTGGLRALGKLIQSGPDSRKPLPGSAE